MPERRSQRCLAAGLMLSIALPVHAQTTTVTTYAGYRGSGQGLRSSTPSDVPLRLASSAAGSLSIDWALDSARQLELFASNQQTELLTSAAGGAAPQRLPIRLSHLHVGGTNFIEGRVGHGAYVVGGLGVTQLTPGLAGYESEIRLSMNLGVGYQWSLSPLMALRTELRGYATLINSSGSFLCSGGGCTVSIKGNTLTQAEALLGLAWSF